MNRLSLLSLVALLVLATDSADAGPRTAPAAADSAPSGVMSELGELAKKMVVLTTEQSIFIPCYAFVPLSDKLTNEKWSPSVSSCYLLATNKWIGLAAPVSFPVVNGKLKIKSMRCMTETAYVDDQIEYKATIGNIAKIEAKHREGKQKTAIDEATINQAANDIDAAKKNYDLVINWRVNVAEGAGSSPQSNQFKGCRIDYTVTSVQ